MKEKGPFLEVVPIFSEAFPTAIPEGPEYKLPSVTSWSALLQQCLFHLAA